MAEQLTVYLDHLMRRESLRYKRSEHMHQYDDQYTFPTLRMCDLTGEHLGSMERLIRKPDFQRATCAWTPDDCVLLLESIIKGQVVPSIIMWYSSESGRYYVLVVEYMTLPVIYKTIIL